jgi:hypothetical protein
MQHLRGESLQPHELLWLDEGVGLYVLSTPNVIWSIYQLYICQVRQGLPENFASFHASGKLLRNFDTQSLGLTPLLQHDPKKLEFIYNLRSRRPGASSALKGLKLCNYVAK